VRGIADVVDVEVAGAVADQVPQRSGRERGEVGVGIEAGAVPDAEPRFGHHRGDERALGEEPQAVGG
jgi:hypothetical protein